jgi:trk system potassium uptake protein TrkA
MRVVILGAGQVGSNLAKKMVREHHDVVIIDRKAEKIQAVEEQMDVLGLVGNGVSLPVMKQAQVEKADLFIAVTRNDDINILACIFAKEFGVPRKIARIRDESYSMDPKHLDLKELGIDFIIHPEETAAKNVVTLIRQAAASDVLEVGGGKMQIIGIKIDNNFPHLNRALMEITPREELHFRTIAIKRKNQTIVPYGKDVFLENDQAYFLVDIRHTAEFLKFMGRKTRKMKNIMILGASRIGMEIARILQNEYQVKIIEKDENRGNRAADRLSRTLIVQGDGTDLDLLVQEGIMEMDVMVAATADDETNFIATLLGKHLEVPRTIAILNNAYYMPITPTIGLDAVVSPQTLIVNQITKYIRSKKVASIASIPGVDAEAIDIIAAEDAQITNGALKDHRFPRGALIGGVIHENGDLEIAVGDTRIHPGDRVILFCLPHTIEKAEKMFRGNEE